MNYKVTEPTLKLEYKMVTPPNPWLKGKTDKVSRRNPGPRFYDFCIRNGEGDLVVATGARIIDSTSLKAEALAIRECLANCKGNDIQHIIIESDSFTMVQIVQGISEVP